ncbi:uncharacterized protein LOC103833526 [Brassica rapa]|uniref:CAP-Gly domain-containing linker protein 1-like n=2 Tax=Brassica TaxID=3705 RepID=A0ABQ8CCT1_BRANA|nr:uncharacterized protein LOC103833526 [Brassica rapa]XP_013654715.1 uncharacterized protein LOC106359588 [Brassica napus]KAH0914869.1 hypothetical protein HID58_029315 [Brassica napus]
MAEQTTADPTFSPALVSVSSPSPPKKENASPVDSKLTELNESRAELLNRILNLKQDLQSWRGKLDTQVQVYREELSGLKKTLNLEVEQLREEFKDLKTTLNRQQDDVSASLKTPGLQDDSKDSKEQMVTEETVEARLTDENAKEAEH